ncbi:MAG: precorrin-4 C(11)-methyltransferase [bacterium]|nr:precorrin-4 C(11)-methyltransferase [bacterium]
MTKGKVYFIGAGPGDPELITVKGKRLLSEADLVVYAGSLVNPALLAFARKEAEIHNSASMTLDEIVGLLIAAAQGGKTVARLQSGDPSIYGAIQEQIAPLVKAGIPFEIVPGVSSVFGSAAALGQELTLPEVSQTLILTRRAGRTRVPDSESLPNLAKAGATMAIFLSVSAIREVVSELLAGGYRKETPAVVVQKATLPDEKIVRGRLENIADLVQAAGIKSTALILVGEVLRASDSQGSDNPAGAITPSRLYNLEFSHEYRKK